MVVVVYEADPAREGHECSLPFSMAVGTVASCPECLAAWRLVADWSSQLPATRWLRVRWFNVAARRRLAAAGAPVRLWGPAQMTVVPPPPPRGRGGAS
jgi:hypothetical protein